MSGSGREALTDVRECSRGPPICPGVVGGPTRMSGSGREALPDVPEWSGGPPEVRDCSVVVSSSLMTLPNNQKW